MNDLDNGAWENDLIEGLGANHQVHHEDSQRDNQELEQRQESIQQFQRSNSSENLRTTNLSENETAQQNHVVDDQRQSMQSEAQESLPPEEEKKLCKICYTERPAHEFYALSCQHEFCQICIKHHLESKIEQRELNRMTCMDADCRQRYHDREV